MIRVNGINYNASVAYPAEKIVASIVSEADFSSIFTNMSNATEIIIVNNGDTVATYPCVFNGIEKISGGYKITFNRAPMTVAEVEALARTVTQQAGAISQHNKKLENNTEELNDILVAITELGNLIAGLLNQGGNE